MAAGSIAGTVNREAVIWLGQKNWKEKNLGEGELIDLNNKGVGLVDAKLWRNGKLTALSDLIGDSATWSINRVGAINDSGVILGSATRVKDAAGNPIPTANQEPHAVLLLPVDIAVDANRDGVIKYAGNYDDEDLADRKTDTTTEAKPFCFWVNDDDDGTGEGEEDTSGSPDSSDNEIKSKRDLEDFTRLDLYIGGLQEAIVAGQIKVGLKWKNVTGTPAVKVWRNLSPDGGLEYLKDDSVAGQHLALQNPGSVQGTTTYVIPQQFWQDVGLSVSQPMAHLLFEGVTEGKGQLVLVFQKSDGTEIGEGPGVWLDLKNIKKLYVRKEGYFTDYKPPYYDSYQDNETANRDIDNTAFEAPSDEEDKVIVFVHGIHGPFENFTDIRKGWYGSAETVFKRLWWQGYKGRFAAYKWEALQPAIPFKFNESEYRGWQFGPALAEFVNSIPRSRKSLMAHSQGNTVCGYALHYSNLTVENYVLMQAAVSASCYDPNGYNINNYEMLALAEVQRGPTPDAALDLGYRGYLPSLNVTRRVVNFQNGIDYALVTGSHWAAWFFSGSTETNWEANQRDTKPQVLTNRAYHYDPNATGILPGDPQHKLIVPGSGALIRAVEDEKESMAFLARSRSKAVGALGATRGSIQSDVGLRGVPYNFTHESSDHGGEFERPIQKAWDFYKTLFDVFK